MIQLINGQVNSTDNFSKEVQMINKYLQNFSTSLAIREMQIKTAL
jgi:hypothetical protein